MAAFLISSPTGLYSLETIEHLVDDLLMHSDRSRTHALFLVDHNGLDAINDKYGREAGDAVIEHTTKVLPAVFRATDLVARTRSDEFVVLMKDVSSLDAIECITGLVLQLLRCPCGTADDAVEATVTIGIATSAGHRPRTFSDLYDNAFLALCDAKRTKGYRFAIYGCDGNPTHGTFGFDKLVTSSTPDLHPFLDTIGNGGVLLRAERGLRMVPQYFSDSFLALMGGMTREEALKVYGDDMMAGMHPGDHQRVAEELAEAIDSNSPLITIARMRAARGSYLWVSIKLTWNRGEGGRIDAFASHVSVESIAENYDYAATGLQKPPSESLTLYLFAVTFSGGAPNGYQLFDGRGALLDDGTKGTLVNALVDGGIVHRDSAAGLADFYRSIEAGEPHGGMLVLCKRAHDGVLYWTRISYLTVYDADGAPLRASGSIRELPHIATAQGRLFREEKLFESVAPRLLCAVRVDLTADVVEDARPSSLAQKGASYESLVSSMVSQYCYADDAVEISRLMSRESVLETIEDETFQLGKEFRREEGGLIRWTSVVVHLAENPANRHIVGFVYVADIERHHIEVELSSPFARPDRRTGLYTKESLGRVVAALQCGETADNPLAGVAVIRVAMPADLRALLSAEDAMSGQVYLGQQLAVCLAQEGLVAKYGTDGFLVLFPRIASENWLRQRVNYAIAILRKAYVDKEGDPHPIVLACGYSVERMRVLRFGDAVARASSACRANDAEPTGSLNSFDDQMGSLRSNMRPGSGRSFRVLSEEDLKRPLTGTEREVCDSAMRALIMASGFDEAIVSVLGALGQFYKAHRVFTAALLENGSVSGLHEWYELGGQPIIGQLVARPLKEYGALQSAASAGFPVLVERSRAQRSKPRKSAEDVWRFIAHPVIRYGMCIGFFCIENPHANENDVALINELIPLVIQTRERERGADLAITGRTRDPLTGLPNESVFERTVMTFDPTMFHSVGVLRVGLERSYTLEGERDIDVEEQELLYVARNLSGLFPLDSVYRTGEMQFTCVCTNMSYDAFNARTTRMAALMRQRMSTGFALCDAWSDTMPSLSKLLEEAATSVYGDRSILFPDAGSHAAAAEPSRWRSLDGNAFSIRLQPQVDLETGKVVGSEALARCSTPDGDVVFPSEFVPRMEAEGEISSLDYFVFDKALATLSSWMDHGLEPVPIAVNFSRRTVQDPSFIASVLAIASRYDVPENLLEIEITESLGSFKNVELHTAMDILHDQGFRFALDDLGSEYSTLSAMSDLPFDTVKLDRLLVKRFIDDSMSRSIVEGIAHACEKNGIRCVAEGVEQSSYIEPLVALGCHYGQGYCFARPMTVDQFTDEYLVRKGGSQDTAAVAPRV